MRQVIAFYFVVLLAAVARADSAAGPLKFSFGSDAVPGFTKVSPDRPYSPDRGYGFENAPDGKIISNDRFCTSDKPFFFSVKVPEGNYRVTVKLGDPAGESSTTVKAELRRLMLENVHTAPGQTVTRSFCVNVRTPKISTGGEVHLKSREKTEEQWNWDDKLTLEFNGSRPCLDTLEISRADDVVTVYLLGDSTVCDQPLEPWNSWGQMLPRFFDDRVAVANHAESGESLRSSLHAQRLDKVLSVIKPGDYLFIQYGHNDMKEKGDGVGAFTTYTADLKKFVEGARQHGGIAVLITSMNRKSFDSSGRVVNTLKDYPDAVRALARQENVPLIDLNAMSKTLYEAIGQSNIDKAFQDGTHHNAYGSYELARCVTAGIRQNNLPLAKHLASDIPAFDPAHPDPIADFHIPASPQTSNRTPLGS